MALEKTDEFMCQAWGEDLYGTGMALLEVDREKVVVKLPMTPDGVTAASGLIKSGVRVCLTACYNKNQALLAGAVGAEYMAPYLGHMQYFGKDGAEECEEMMEICKGLGSDTRVLVASVRYAETMAKLAAAGMDTFTFSPDVARELFDEPLTTRAANVFEDDARSVSSEGNYGNRGRTQKTFNSPFQGSNHI